MSALDPEHLRLTDFLDLATLQEIQDGFAAVANVKATITDAQGLVLTQPTPTREFVQRQRAIAQAEENVEVEAPQKSGREYVAPIMVNNQRLGTIRMTTGGDGVANTIDETRLLQLSQKYGLDFKQIRSLATSLLRARNARPAAIQFLYLLANAIARLCYQEFQLRQRVDELTAVYNLSMMLSDARELQRVLDRTVMAVCEIMGTKAASIRLLDQEHDELVVKAAYNLSPQYVQKGPVRLSKSEIDHESVSAVGHCYVRNMASDRRVLYPADAAREGIVSLLSVGMRYRGKAVGVLRVYTDTEQTFTQLRINLLKAVAAQAAATIENARLLEETLEAEALEKQVRMAAEVQQRMIPRDPPKVRGVEFASVYVPCFELGGDFYDFIELPDDNVGLVIADVSGKGVPASLIMASVRAALRAQVDNVYYLYEVVRRLNLMLHRDTKPTEFVTLFYGVLDTKNRRLTYCNAGHPPGLLHRGGQIVELGGDNMVLGIDAQQPYRQSIVHLEPDDLLLLYTDGLPDAMNFNKETFGRQRVLETFKQGGGSAEAVAQNLLWSMRRFVGLTKRTDDVTMIVTRIA
jgi:sigma-B regulation protein RsbU (phosphoserine phosphatase)